MYVSAAAVISGSVAASAGVDGTSSRKGSERIESRPT
jgi:hypothetical protein